MSVFSGELLHQKRDLELVPVVALVTGNDITLTYEIEIFPAAFFKMGQVKLPILKECKLRIIPNDTGLLSIVNNGSWVITAKVYNADADDIDEAANLITEATFIIADIDAAATIIPFVLAKDGIINYGENNGILLRPTITLVIYINNASGANIPVQYAKVTVDNLIDWILVSDEVMKEYLMELWLAQEFD